MLDGKEETNVNRLKLIVSYTVLNLCGQLIRKIVLSTVILTSTFTRVWCVRLSLILSMPVPALVVEVK